MTPEPEAAPEGESSQAPLRLPRRDLLYARLQRVSTLFGFSSDSDVIADSHEQPLDAQEEVQ